MVLRDLIRDVFQTLWAHKLRTALTMFGIAWGVISIVLMVAAGEGLRQGQAKVAQNFGKDLMIIFAGRTSLQAGGARAGRRVEFEDYRDPLSCRAVSRLRVHPAGGGAGQCPHSQQLQRQRADDGRIVSAVRRDSLDHRGRGPLLQLERRVGGAPGRLSRHRGAEAAFCRTKRAGRKRLHQRHSVQSHWRDEGQGPGLELRRLRRQQDLHPLLRDPRGFSQQASVQTARARPPAGGSQVGGAAHRLQEPDPGGAGAGARVRSSRHRSRKRVGHHRGSRGLRDHDQRHEDVSRRGRALPRCFWAAWA